MFLDYLFVETPVEQADIEAANAEPAEPKAALEGWLGAQELGALEALAALDGAGSLR